MDTCLKTKQILYPWGGCGNLLRWIVYLDKEYDPQFTGAEKVQYIKDIVYGPQKNWANWRDMEYIHNDRASIEISHQRLENFDNTKTLLIHFNDVRPIVNRFFILMPDLWAKPYAKFGVIDHLANRTDIVNSLIESESLKIITGDLLFVGDTLDYNLYLSIIEYFDFENQYELANEVFIAWKECERRAVKEFTEAYSGDRLQNLLKTLYEQNH
jgi:hypothetical protein